jgi:hypothetical protein
MRPTDPNSTQTDVGEFITDLDGGHFDHMLGVALSRVAAAVIDHEKKGKVTIDLDFERINGTHQVRVGHAIKYTQPTEHGKLIEHGEGATVLHVGRGGKLSLAQQQLIGKQGEIAGN